MQEVCRRNLYFIPLSLPIYKEDASAGALCHIVCTEWLDLSKLGTCGPPVRCLYVELLPTVSWDMTSPGPFCSVKAFHTRGRWGLPPCMTVIFANCKAQPRHLRHSDYIALKKYMLSQQNGSIDTYCHESNVIYNVQKLLV